MRRKWLILLTVFTVFLFSGCENKPSDEQLPQGQHSETREEIDPIREQIKTMTLEEKIGQILLVGLEGYELDEQAKEMIETYRVGGFILYEKNIKDAEQLLALVNSLKAANSKNPVPLFLSIDEEGGKVSRLPAELLKLPAGKKIGKVKDAAFSYEIGNIIAEELKSFGLNMNFAPVLDIHSNPKNAVIGNRAFGSDEKVVSEMGVQMMKGIQSGEVVSVVKHFPGHGDTTVDSHIGLPVVEHDLDRLKRFEWIPFMHAISNGAEAVMVGHILFPKIDSQNPATFSKILITKWLKEELKFDGLIITDDMTMGAIIKNYHIGDAAVKSVLAGSDIILVAHEYEKAKEVMQALKEAVANDRITKNRLDESVYKILQLKEKYKIKDQPIHGVDIDRLNERIRDTLRKYLK